MKFPFGLFLGSFWVIWAPFGLISGLFLAHFWLIFGSFLAHFWLISGSFLARTRTKSFVDVNDSVHLVKSNNPYFTKHYLDMKFTFVVFWSFGSFLAHFRLISGSFLARPRTKLFVEVNDSDHLVKLNDLYSNILFGYLSLHN